MKLNVLISKTSRGDKDYLQVISEDMVSVNIVLISDEVKIQDKRES